MRLTIEPNLCRFAADVRVRWADTDAVGIAYNGAYLTWFEVARVEYYRCLKAWKLGVPLADPAVQDRLFSDRPEVFTLVSSTVNWRMPARVDERLRIATRVARIGESSFDHHFVMTRVADPLAVIALGESTQVRVDPNTLQPLRLEPHMRADLEAFERALATGELKPIPMLS